MCSDDLLKAERRAAGELVSELVEYLLVGLVVGHEDLVAVFERLGVALELLGGHLGVGPAFHEDATEGDALAQAEVCEDVAVRGPHDGGQLLDGVPAEGLTAQGGYELLLALDPVEVAA